MVHQSDVERQVDKRGLPLPSQSTFSATGGMLRGLLMRRQSSQPTSATSTPNPNQSVAFDEETSVVVSEPLIISETAYGDVSVDAGGEVRFSVELTRIDRLKGTYSLEVRRLKGNLNSYGYLYETFRQCAVSFWFGGLPLTLYFSDAPIYNGRRLQGWRHFFHFPLIFLGFQRNAITPRSLDVCVCFYNQPPHMLSLTVNYVPYYPFFLFISHLYILAPYPNRVLFVFFFVFFSRFCHLARTAMGYFSHQLVETAGTLWFVFIHLCVYIALDH